MRLSRRNRWLLLLLILFLLTQSAFIPGPLTRTAVKLQLLQSGSDWTRALPAEFRGDLATFAEAPVHRYVLTYDPDSHKLSGTTEILFTNRSGHVLNTIYMRTLAKVWGPGNPDDFALTDLKVNGRPAAGTVGQTLIAITPAEPVPEGKSARITFAATVTLPTLSGNPGGKLTASSNVGLYGAGWDVTGLGGFPGLLPNGEEGNQYDALPENDYPDNGYPGIDDVWMTIPADWTAIAFGTILDETPAHEGWKTVHATAVKGGGGGGGNMLITRARDMAIASRQVGGLTVTTYVPKFYAEYSAAVMKDAVDAATTFREAYGQLPMKKLDVLAIPLGGGIGGAYCGGGVLAIANTLLSDFHSSAPDRATPYLRPLLERNDPLTRRKVVFHEVAHAWWGEMVTPDTAAPWWHEAMANTSAVYAMERLDGAARADSERIKLMFPYQKMRAFGMPDAPLDLPMSQYQSLQHRNFLVYYKGSLFFDRLRKQVGDDKFFAAMRTFLREHVFESVAEPGPVAGLMNEPGVADLYRRWVQEAHGDEDIGLLDLHDATFRRLLGLPAE